MGRSCHFLCDGFGFSQGLPITACFSLRENGAAFCRNRGPLSPISEREGIRDPSFAIGSFAAANATSLRFAVKVFLRGNVILIILDLNLALAFPPPSMKL